MEFGNTKYLDFFTTSGIKVMIVDFDFVEGLLYSICGNEDLTDIQSLLNNYKDEYVKVTSEHFKQHSSIVFELQRIWQKLHSKETIRSEKSVLYDSFDSKVRQTHLLSAEFEKKLKEFQKIFDLLEAEIKRLNNKERIY